MSGYHRSTIGTMSTHAFEFWQRRQAEQRREEREQRRLAKLEREAAEPAEPSSFDDWAKEIREHADGTVGRREPARRELAQWNRKRLQDRLADRVKATRSMFDAADMIAEAL